MRKLLRVTLVLLLAFAVCFVTAACTTNESVDPDVPQSGSQTGNNGSPNTPEQPDSNPAGGGNSTVPEGPGTVLADEDGYLFRAVYVEGTAVGCELVGIPDIREAVIPAECDGLPVTSIASLAIHRSPVNKVVVPDSVTTIGERAFSLSYDLETVEFGSNSALTVIGNRAFFECNSLTNIVLPNGVTEIGESAFAGTALTAINVTDALVKVGKNACDFVAEGKSGLVHLGKVAYTYVPTVMEKTANVVIPEGTVAIASGAFEGSDVITSVTIPATVSYIGENAFTAIGNLEALTVAEDNTVYKSLGNALLSCDGDVLLYGTKNTVIPDCTKSIAADAFNGIGIASVVIPDGVSEIGERAFKNAKKLVSVTLPAGLEALPAEVFMGASSLASIRIPARVRTVATTAFTYCDGLVTVILDSAWVYLNANNEHDVGHLLDNADTVYVRGADVVANVGYKNADGSSEYRDMTMADEIAHLSYIGQNASNGNISGYLRFKFSKQSTSALADYDEWRRA